MPDADPHAAAAASGHDSTTRPDAEGASFASGVELDAVRHVLGEIQRRGGIGRGPLDDAIAHALAYVRRLPGATGVAIDLGSGGGLPGLVIAVAAPGWELHLVERRLKRADLLQFGVRALGLGERVIVHGEDLERFVPHHLARADAVTARSFAPPLTVLRTARPLLRHPGSILVSDAPDRRARWTDQDLAVLDLVDDGSVDGIRRVVTR